MPREISTTKTTKKSVKPKAKKEATSRKTVKEAGAKKTAKPAAPKAPLKKKVAAYTEAVGRRKTAVARVRISPGKEKTFSINGKDFQEYFPVSEVRKTIVAPLDLFGDAEKFNIFVKVKGGGYNAQAEAIRHGLARVMIKIDADYKKPLKKTGFLTRDSRMRERKKFGLKRARRAPQWSKR